MASAVRWPTPAILARSSSFRRRSASATSSARRAPDLAPAPLRKSLNLGFQLPNQRLVPIRFEARLHAGRILFDLFDQPEALFQCRKPRIRSLADLVGLRRANRDQAGIDFVVLGSRQPETRVGPNLHRLQDDKTKHRPRSHETTPRS
jgi:hypothetical protein